MDNTNHAELVISLASALRNIAPVAMSGRHQQGYPYAKPGDVLGAVREPLLAENLVLLLEDVEVLNESWDKKEKLDTGTGQLIPVGWRHVATIKASWVLVHPAGELRLTTLGSGVDENGQGGAISKATTDAHKDALSLLGHLVYEEPARGGGQQGEPRQERSQGRQQEPKKQWPKKPSAPTPAPAATPGPSIPLPQPPAPVDTVPAISLDEARALFGGMAWEPLGQELLTMEKQVAGGGAVAVPFARAALERLAVLLPAAAQAKDAAGRDKLLRWAGGLAHNDGLGDMVARDALILAIGKANGLGGGAS